MMKRITRSWLPSWRKPWFWMGLAVAVSFSPEVFSRVAAFATVDDDTVQTTIEQDEQLKRGQQIYRESCASCHGAFGEGVQEHYPDKLVGDATVLELADDITQTMPEEAPEECVGADAEAVAAYIHFAFYSEAARIRNRPPRRELSRLTANQLRQSLADLYAHFEGIRSVTEERGVNGVYFDGDRWNDENKKIERVDGTIDFDWGDDGPGAEIKPESFFIHWQGALKVDVTGEYEIVVDSTCSFVMDFGRNERRLIDNHVQSGDQTEFRRTLTLTAGRVYPFKIDFRQRDRKTERPPARIRLAWVPPGGVEQVIPERYLLPGWWPATFTVSTQLPPDDRSYGYERGISVNREWDEATTQAAFEMAQIAIDELWPAYRERNKDQPNENRSLLRAFLTEFVSVAFGGELDEATRQRHIDAQLDATEDDSLAIKRVVVLALKSPSFLYPLADEDESRSWRAANRLALTLLDSIPADKWLLEQAQNGGLESEEQVRQAARRMLNDYRTQAKVRDLMYAWLNMNDLREVVKDEESFPEFDRALVADLRASLDAFLDEVAWGETGDFRQLFTADWSFTTDRIQEFYGQPWESEEASPAWLRRTVSDPEHRFGALTHPYVLSRLAYLDSTSPIHRGVFLNRFVLGRALRTPNAAFAPFSPDLHPDLTTRQRVALQTGDEACQACHIRINPLGFALENYDAVGRFRNEERGQPVDASGNYLTLSNELVSFTGAGELAHYLANSPDATRAFVNRAFQHFVKQPPGAYGAGTLDELVERFAASGYNIRALLVDIAVIAATRQDSPSEQEL
ncbi:MAG: DUF1592 domain-containing protein [Pirellulaceae bacterium]